MTQDQIEAVRRDISALRNGLLYPWQHDAAKDRILAALDQLTKANEELRAEVEKMTTRLQNEAALTNARDTELADLTADLTEARATIARLTKERDEARAWHQASQEALADQLEARKKAEDQADKFKWQVRDTCTRAEKAEARRSTMQAAVDKAATTLEAMQHRDDCTGSPDFPNQCGCYLTNARAILHPFATKPEPEADPLVEEIYGEHGWRRRELQALGAAISTRNWHALETSYNQLRDRIDRTALAARGGRVVFDGSEG